MSNSKSEFECECDPNGKQEEAKYGNINNHPTDDQQNQPLTFLEKKFLLAVERGDAPAVKRLLSWSTNSLNAEQQTAKLNINCCDPLGRTGLLMAIDNENIEMIQLLLSYGVQMKDALLHAINEEFVEAVELLLDHENIIHSPGTPHSWEALESETFTSDITPLVLAAHRNNYEIIKIILDRNISSIPTPHHARCGCRECRIASKQDCLRHSRSRINAYKALSSPSLIALYSSDPILTAFELSWQLRRLSFLEPEFKKEYLELRKQCQMFATALLDHTRTSEELETLLDYDPDDSDYDDDTLILQKNDRKQLSRLKLAIKIKQKMFCAHPNVQQLLASIWYEGLPGFRRKNIFIKLFQVIGIGLLFPLLSLAYIVAPHSTIGKLVKKPFIKFICHSASYLTFLGNFLLAMPVLLMLASQRIESNILFGKNPTNNMENNDHPNHQNIQINSSKRGALPSHIELCILTWVLGLIWSEIKQLWDLGINEYLVDMWNILDFINNSIYVATIALRVIAYKQTQKEIAIGKASFAFERENWDDFDPMLLSEGLFATANIFSALKIVYIFSINPYLGPLQISLGRMIIDILKFFFFYLLVLFSFACGMNQLLWYYADMEKQNCINQQSMVANSLENLNDSNITVALARQQQQQIYNEVLHPDACFIWRRFANLFESTQTLFWATFGLIDLDNFELTGIKSYTRFWALVLFGVYCICNVTVLLNLLIAMMNHSYQLISEQSDTEWKFARSKLWISYFGDGATVPPPFNIIPTPKSFQYLFQWFSRWFCCSKTKKAKNKANKTIRNKKQRKANERDLKYYQVVRSLIRRYVMNEQRIQERQRGVTEDDCNEIKQEVSALRYDLLEMLGQTKKAATDINVPISNGNGGNSANSCQMGKKSRQRERRLLKGFHFGMPMENRMTSLDDDDIEDVQENNPKKTPKSDMNSIDNGTSTSNLSTIKNNNKFYRAAQSLAYRKRGVKWKQFIEATRINKMLTFSKSQDSIQSDLNVTTATINTMAANQNVIDNNNSFYQVPLASIDAHSKRQIFSKNLDSSSCSLSFDKLMSDMKTESNTQNNNMDTNMDNGQQKQFK